MSKNFFKVLFSVCTGTDVFRKITEFSLLRAFWHLLLISFFCSFAFVLSNSSAMNNSIKSTAGYFQKEFGNVVLKPTGLYPQKNPEKPRSINYNSIQVNYYPQLPPKSEVEIDSELNNSGILWQPKSIIGWLKLNDSEVFLYQALTSENSHNWFGIFPKDEIYSYFQNSSVNDFNYLRFTFLIPDRIPLFGLLPVVQNNNFMLCADSIFYWSAFGLLIHFILMIVFNVLLFSLLFSAVYSILNRANPTSDLKFKSFLKVAIYAGFPAIIIGTVFTMAEIPWIQYQTIYLVAFIVYWITIMKKIRKWKLDRGN